MSDDDEVPSGGGAAPQGHKPMDRAAIITAMRQAGARRKGGRRRERAGRVVSAGDGGTAASLVAGEKTDFTTLPLFQQIEMQRAAGEMAGLDNPFFALHEGRAGTTTQIDGRCYLNFSSYDYLGLNAHAEVAQAAKDAIERYGTSVSASRPTAGNRPLHVALERQLADLYAAEEALVFVSGHATNVSTIGCLMGPGDLILYDSLSHNSLTVGCELSGAARRSFRHNDLVQLESLLQQNRLRHERALIIVEGLYSMDGDVPDLARLIALKKRYGAWLMVDEAHALGVLGARGHGSFEACGVDPQEVDIWMGTLSKTLAGCGGYIAGSRALIEILRYHASGFMFSVGMSPPVAAAALRALQLMHGEPERVARLRENGRFFQAAARQAGLDTGLSAGYCVVPIIIGDSLRTALLSQRLLRRGIFTIPVVPPGVPERSARIRFFITSEHKKEDLQKTVHALAEEMQVLQREDISVARLAERLRQDTASGELE